MILHIMYIILLSNVAFEKSNTKSERDKKTKWDFVYAMGIYDEKNALNVFDVTNV